MYAKERDKLGIYTRERNKIGIYTREPNKIRIYSREPNKLGIFAQSEHLPMSHEIDIQCRARETSSEFRLNLCNETKPARDLYKDQNKLGIHKREQNKLGIYARETNKLGTCTRELYS
jgi:hypothetical protein